MITITRRELQEMENMSKPETRALAVREEMELSVAEVENQVKKIQQLMKAVMQDGEHYGVIPGMTKKTLLKPGAEKLCLTFRFDPQYEAESRYDGDHLTVKSKCVLYHIGTGKRLGSGEGMCSTKETKYAYRNQAPKCPDCGKETIIKGKAEFGGGWLCWKKKGGCGKKYPDDAFSDEDFTRVANPDLPDLYNTVLKMADKRALVAAVLNATAASDIFTQDMEEAEEKPATKAIEIKKSPAGRREQSDIPIRKVLWDNLCNHCSGNKTNAGAILKELTGKSYYADLTDDEAISAQMRFEQEYLHAESREPGEDDDVTY
jgi:hypothetical protein